MSRAVYIEQPPVEFIPLGVVHFTSSGFNFGSAGNGTDGKCGITMQAAAADVAYPFIWKEFVLDEWLALKAILSHFRFSVTLRFQASTPFRLSSCVRDFLVAFPLEQLRSWMAECIHERSFD